MGVELVEGGDLLVKDGYVYMRTTAGRQRVDVIYRRVDDAFLDPLAFRQDSLLGVPGLLSVYRAGQRRPRQRHRHRRRRRQVDLSVRAGDDPLLPRRGAAAAQRADLAVQEARGPRTGAGSIARAGGEGSPGLRRLRHADRARPRRRPRSRPSARASRRIPPTTSRSRRCRSPPARPSSSRASAPRHVDLRPYVLSGKEVKLVPGGLTRVALKEGSLVVNSSQGGGTKDTWVVD